MVSTKRGTPGGAPSAPKRRRMTPTRMTPATVRTIARNVQKAHQETKYYDSGFDAPVNNTNSAGSLVLNALVPGPLQSQRLGAKVSPVGVNLRGQIRSDNNSRGVAFRLLVIEKKNATISFTADGLQLNDGDIALTNTGMGPIYNGVNLEKYKVHLDRQLNLTYNDQHASFNTYVPLSGTMKYDKQNTQSEGRELMAFMIPRDAAAVPAGTTLTRVTLIARFFFKDA